MTHKIKDSKKNVSVLENIFNVRVLGFDIHIPLFIMFRVLGIETDKDILSYIVYNTDNDQLKNKLYELIFPRSRMLNLFLLKKMHLNCYH